MNKHGNVKTQEGSVCDCYRPTLDVGCEYQQHQ
jgi:hypothetical protein